MNYPIFARGYKLIIRLKFYDFAGIYFGLIMVIDRLDFLVNISIGQRKKSDLPHISI